MRTLVTGGAGFIGSHVADALVGRGDDVTVVDNLSTGSETNIPDGARVERRDIREDRAPVLAEVEPELCFRLAAQADGGPSVDPPDLDAEVNVLGTRRVRERARTRGVQVVC